MIFPITKSMKVTNGSQDVSLDVILLASRVLRCKKFYKVVFTVVSVRLFVNFSYALTFC
jgi:hypothetical protein